MKIQTDVTRIAAANSDVAAAHFAAKLHFETDCWDVHHGLGLDEDFLLVDVRSEALFARGHVPGATNIPRARLSKKRLADYPREKLFVVYCAGPHCNSADKAALQLARQGRPVKIMIGGVTGWVDEGFSLATIEEVA